MELYGLSGSILVPDPNYFSGDILVSNMNSEWERINNDNMLMKVLVL